MVRIKMSKTEVCYDRVRTNDDSMERVVTTNEEAVEVCCKKVNIIVLKQ